MPRYAFSVATTTTRAGRHPRTERGPGQTKNPGKSGIENGRQAKKFRKTKIGRRKGGHSSDPGFGAGGVFFLFGCGCDGGEGDGGAT